MSFTQEQRARLEANAAYRGSRMFNQAGDRARFQADLSALLEHADHLANTLDLVAAELETAIASLELTTRAPERRREALRIARAQLASHPSPKK